MKEKPGVQSGAGATLEALAEEGIRFVLTFEPGVGYRWYLPNPWGPEDQEDWIFHALRHGGHDSSLEAAVEQLATGVRLQFPESKFALRRSR